MLILKASVSLVDSATAIKVYDKTGISTTGWNYSGNPTLAQATSAVIRVYLPDATTLLPQTTYTEVNAFPTLPNIANTPKEITAATLGYTSGTLADGWYIIKYIVVAAGVTYTATVQKIVTFTACCCVETAEANADFDCDCSGDTTLWKSLKLRGMMNTVNKLVSCYKNRKSISTLLEMQSICNGSDCSDC